jgi:hypothetical protein
MKGPFAVIRWMEWIMRAAAVQNVGLLIGLAFAIPAPGQTYTLSESPAEGDCVRFTLETNLTGTLKVTRDGKPLSLRVSAKNEHTFAERALEVRNGVTRKAARFYAVATSRATVDGSPIERSLSPDRRLVVAYQKGNSLTCFALAGPLTRTELDVVREHFDTLHLAGLLPGKPVGVGDAWKLDSATAQALCLFDGLISHDLSVRLEHVTATVASLAVTGTAKGIENGALANLTVAATAKYDRNARRIVEVDWKQKDVREQGPVTPAAEIETTTKLKRDRLETAPPELTAAALVRVPAADDPPVEMTSLVHQDSKERFRFLYARDWHIVGQTDHHLVMRLLDRGDFVAQATLTPWRNAGAGKHMSPEEFERLTAGGTGWQLEQVLDRQEVPTDPDRWVYRISARGNLEGSAVSQAFYLVATASGEQMILTFTMKPAAAARLGTRDLVIVNAIEFPRK